MRRRPTNLVWNDHLELVLVGGRKLSSVASTVPRGGRCARCSQTTAMSSFRQMPHCFTDRWLVSVTFGAQWEEFTSLHHAANWLAAHGVRVSASTLYAMYYRHRWEGTERASAR
eukprot:COSAG02_NODE_7596_length_2943_cov_4.723980_4_plen_113_part_01